jgi:hypothetical protein
MDRERLIEADISGYSEEKKDRAMEDQFNSGNQNKMSGNIFVSKKDKKKDKDK